MKPASLLLLLAVAAANIHNYKGDDAWPPLQQALADYPKLHASELEKIKNGDESARYLILDAFNGLGNRERGMMSAFAFALVNRLAFFVRFPTVECNVMADKKGVACNPAELNDMYKSPPFDWTAVSRCSDDGPGRTDVGRRLGWHGWAWAYCIGGNRVGGGGSAIDFNYITEEEVLRFGVEKVGPRVLMHSDHTLLKYFVCDQGVKKTGLFPPDFFAAQRQIEAFLLRPNTDVRDRAAAALKAADGCAVGLHLRGRGSHEPADVFLDDLEPALAAAPGGLFVLGDGNNAELKKDIIKHAQKRGIQVLEVEDSGQKGGLTAALAENLVFSSCAMLVPTVRSSFFSIAAVRAAGRREVRDAFFCGTGHNRSVPLPGPPCLSHCMFNTTCPRLDERDRVSSHLDHFFDPEIPHSQTSSRILDCMKRE
mmetsp:Transcript_11031/g.33185  ORF Transcript_11031/g.33185 Transcript_11031/m.33185 type:complete len:425 (-) Transcript_11031:145-1419(-)